MGLLHCPLKSHLRKDLSFQFFPLPRYMLEKGREEVGYLTLSRGPPAGQVAGQGLLNQAVKETQDLREGRGQQG